MRLVTDISCVCRLSRLLLIANEDAGRGAVSRGVIMQLVTDVSCVCRLSRLLLIANEDAGRLLEEEVCLLEDRVQELYHRPYLAKGSAERALILLKALLQVAAMFDSLIRWDARSLGVG